MTIDKRVCNQCLVEQPASQFSWKGEGHKRLTSRCHSCRRKNYKENPNVARERSKSYYWDNREIISARQRVIRQLNAERRMLAQAKRRATEKNIPFDLVLDDIKIPDFCPVLLIPLKFGVGRPAGNSPSLDRVIPELGYVRGNVIVVSYRANTIKSDATAEEIMAVANFYKSAALAVAVTFAETTGDR